MTAPDWVARLTGALAESERRSRTVDECARRWGRDRPPC